MVFQKRDKINHWLPVYWSEEGIVYKESQGNLREVDKIVSSLYYGVGYTIVCVETICKKRIDFTLRKLHLSKPD